MKCSSIVQHFLMLILKLIINETGSITYTYCASKAVSQSMVGGCDWNEAKWETRSLDEDHKPLHLLSS